MWQIFWAGFLAVLSEMWQVFHIHCCSTDGERVGFWRKHYSGGSVGHISYYDCGCRKNEWGRSWKRWKRSTQAVRPLKKRKSITSNNIKEEAGKAGESWRLLRRSSWGERETTGKQNPSKLRRVQWSVYSYMCEEYGATAVTDPFGTKMLQW